MPRSIFVVLLVLACSRTEKLGAQAIAQTTTTDAGAAAPGPALASPRTPPVRPPAPEKPTSERERAELLFNEAITRHGSYTAMAANAGSQRSNIRRFELGLDVFQAKMRCPSDPDTGELERLLRSLAEAVKAPVESLKLEVAPTARRAFPKEVPDGTRLEVSPDDVRGVVAIRLVLRAEPDDALLRKLVGETIALKRLIVWSQAEKVQAGGKPALALRGEAYWFYPDVTISKVAHQPPTFQAALGAKQLDERTADPAAREHIAKAKKLYEEIAAKRNDYAEVLELVRKTVVVGAQFNFLRERRARQDAALGSLKITSVP